MAVRKIIYIGEDASYWNELKHRFKSSYENTDFEFVMLQRKADEHYQSLYIKMFELKPCIIYVDLSKHNRDQLKLANLMRREASFNEIPMVGLVDKRELLRGARVCGLDFIHVKCGEYHDIVFDPYLVKFPKEVKKPQFATAKVDVKTELREDLRIGYITPTSLHAEGSYPFEEGQVVELHSAIPEKVIPSKKFIVRSTTDSNLYYDHKYSYDMEFVFVDKPELEKHPEDPALAEERYNEAIAEYDIKLKRVKKKNKEWVVDNMDMTAPKKTKILIVDKNISVLKDEENPLDSYPYSIRCQTLLSEEFSEINYFRPNLFVFQYPNFHLTPQERMLSEEEQEAIIANLKEEENEITLRLGEIVRYIKSLDNYGPFILVYNSKNFDSRWFQDELKYPLILANSSDLHIENVVQLAEVYEKKQDAKLSKAIEAKIKQLKQSDARKYRSLTASDFQENKFYIKKNHDLSFVSVDHDIQLLAISESVVKISSPQDLELGIYRLNFPTKMSITLIPVDGKKSVPQGGQFIYTGLIHSIGEEEKKIIRQYVNEIFSAPAAEKREKDKAEFESINKKVIEERAKKEGEAMQAAAEARIKEKMDKLKGVEREVHNSDDAPTEEVSEEEKDSFGFKKN